MKFSHCLRIVFVIGKYTDVFGGREILYLGWISIGRNFQREGAEFPRENLTLGDFEKCNAKSLLIVLHSLCQLNFACTDVPEEISRSFPGIPGMIKKTIRSKVFFK